MDNEPSPMTTEVMLARMRDFGQLGVSQTAALIMGGVFATSAVTFPEILRADDALPARFTGWLVGVTASLTVVDSLVRRSLVEARPSFHAVPFIGAAGMLSMLGFAFLSPHTGGADGWRYSQLAMFLAAVLFGRSWGSSLAEHVEPALQPLYEGRERVPASAGAGGRFPRPGLSILGMAASGQRCAGRPRAVDFDYADLSPAFGKLSKPAKRALINNAIFSPGDLAKWSRRDLAELHGVGPSALPILAAALQAAHLDFSV